MADLYDLLRYINFTDEDLEEIEGALNNLKETIVSKSKSNYDDDKIPQPLDFIKFGSIARKTKIKPLDDVDVIYVVGTAEKQLNNNMHTITKCSIGFDINKQEPINNISSLIFLNDIKAAIKQTYSSSDVRRNQEVVNVFLKSYEVGFDIVPAFYITNFEYYLIPKGGGSHWWKKTKPISGEIFFNRVNIKHSGQVRNAIKIIKYWFQKKKIKTPDSYHLECGLCYSFYKTNREHSVLKDALWFCFANINYNNHLNSCPDPSGLGDNLTSALSNEDITNIVEKANEAKEILNSSISDFVNYIDEDI